MEERGLWERVHSLVEEVAGSQPGLIPRLVADVDVAEHFDLDLSALRAEIEHWGGARTPYDETQKVWWLTEAEIYRLVSALSAIAR